MHIGIVGFGYIGAVIGAFFSGKGHRVSAIDTNDASINNLNNGICLVPEPSLSEMIKVNVEAGLLSGSTSYEVLSQCDVILVTVGTPLSDEFDADLSAIEEVFKNLSEHVVKNQIIMIHIHQILV